MKIPGIFNGDKTYCMSDLHYGHRGILKFGYSERANYKDVPEMNQAIEEEIKLRCTPADWIFDLGDMFWKTDQSDIERIVRPISSKLYKVWGNHDAWKFWSVRKDLAKVVGDLFEIQVSSMGKTWHLVLSHYPLLSWPGKFRGSLMIHGHCHGDLDALNSSSPDLRLDIGYDAQVARDLGKHIFSLTEIINYINNGN